MAISDAEKTARARRKNVFDRHTRAAEDGIHLPTLLELLKGCPFLSNDFHIDMQIYAERMMRRLKANSDIAVRLKQCLEQLTASPTVDELIVAAEAMKEYSAEAKARSLTSRDNEYRLRLYAACMGDEASMISTGLYALDCTMPYRPEAEIWYDYFVAGIGLLIISKNIPVRFRSSPQSLLQAALNAGADIVDRLNKEEEIQRHLLISATDAKTAPKVTAIIAPVRYDAPEQPAAPTAIVIGNLGGTESSILRDIEKDFKPLVGTPLPLALCPDLKTLRDRLLDDFPYAAELVESCVEFLIGQVHVRFEPFILVGDPGSGKSTFCRTFLTLLGIPHETYSCGGVADGSIAGTARRWASGEPSLPVSLIKQFRHASPGVILDEVEKASASRHNGRLADAILTFLEPSSAKKWYDPFLQADVDLSHVVWCATANDLKGVPRTLIDRCRVFHFPAPGKEYTGRLANKVLIELAESRSLDHRWMAPLSAEEIEFIDRHWDGKSFRTMKRLVHVVVRSREVVKTIH